MMTTAALILTALAGLAGADPGVTVVTSAPASPPPAQPPAVCEPQCPLVIHKVCVPTPETKKVTRVVYSCKAEDYCLPKHPKGWLFGWCKRCCCEGGCLECSAPRTRRLLVKKIITEEEPVVRCKVQQVAAPACEPACPAPACPTAAPAAGR